MQGLTGSGIMALFAISYKFTFQNCKVQNNITLVQLSFNVELGLKIEARSLRTRKSKTNLFQQENM